MVKVSVFYPASAGARFDMDYYWGKHIPMVMGKLAPACTHIDVDAGVSSAEPGSAAPFVAIAHLHFASVEAFYAAWGPHADSILGDIPNYTDIAPTVQISSFRTLR